MRRLRHMLASHADVLRGSSRVPAPRTSAELKDKFLFHCSQISAGDHMQIIGDSVLRFVFVLDISKQSP